MQTATSLPVFLVGLPAGALADIVDRRRLLLFTQGLMLAAAGLLSAATIAGVIDAKGLLASTFCSRAGCGAQTRQPGRRPCQIWFLVAICRRSGPERVTVQCGARSRTCPRGAIVPHGDRGGIPPEYSLVHRSPRRVYRWRPRPSKASCRQSGWWRYPSRVRYARHAPELQAVLIRAGVFIGAGSALWALLPIVVRHELGLGRRGSVFSLAASDSARSRGRRLLPRLRVKYSLDHALIGATVVFALVTRRRSRGSLASWPSPSLMVAGE